jgi:predicted alpha/beta-hydrolase family hydrolase
VATPDRNVRIKLVDGRTVSGLFTEAPAAFACIALAHGAGAGMHHPFMRAVAGGLAQRDVTTLRYQFPFMEAGSKRVDRPPTAHVAVRAAILTAIGTLPLFAGGKSFGARMTSQAQALEPLPSVRGLVFFGFPLHPAGKPSTDRARHLWDVHIPMLFLQGTRDALADIGLIEGVVSELGHRARIVTIQDADHSFHVPARSGRTDHQVLEQILDAAAKWMRQQSPTARGDDR